MTILVSSMPIVLSNEERLITIQGLPYFPRDGIQPLSRGHRYRARGPVEDLQAWH